MASVFYRRRRLIGALLVLVALFVLLSLKWPVSRWARRPVTTVVTPVLRAVEAVGRWVGRVGEAVIGRGGVAERNALRRRLAALEAEAAALEAELASVRQSAAQLEELAGRGLTLVPARVVAREPSSWYDTAIINAGTGRGVRRGMQVVMGRWYVGRIEEAGPGWARVMLVLDARSTVPAAAGGTRGLVETTSARTLVFKYLADGPQVRLGDAIVTSRIASERDVPGMDFVEGFEIGIVTFLGGEEGGWQTAVLGRPPALDQLSEVMVVIAGEDAQ